MIGSSEDRIRLELERQRLRHRGLVASGSPGERWRRAQLLDEVCRRLVEDHGRPASYYLGVGDMLPSAPDDLSELGGR